MLNHVKMHKLLLIILTLFNFVLITCGMCRLAGTVSCVGNLEDACNFTHDNTQLHFKPRNNKSDNAEYDVEFIASKNRCGFDSYDVNLELLVNVDNEKECVYNYNVINEVSVHAFKIYNTEENCSKVKLEFCIMYWFTGCYLLSIAPRTGSNSHKPVSYYIWMENNYTIDDFSIGRPIFKPFNLEPLEASWKFGPGTFRKDDPKFFVRLGQTNKIDEAEYSTDVTENCTLSDQTVTCKFFNLPVGNYSTHFTLDDEWRCRSQDLIFNACDWPSIIERYKPPNSSEYKFESVNTPTKYLDWIIITSLIAIFLCLVLSVYWYKTQSGRSYSDPPIEIHSKSESKKYVKGILLLYARDCQPFMETMVELRRYFIIQTRCKVYDIFDSSLFDEIATSPHEFIEALLQDPHINVVIIATECYQQLYQSMLDYFSNQTNYNKEISHLTQIYRIPHWLDGLVLHALKLISYDTSASSYKKFFVVRLPKFNNSTNFLMHINPCTRFDLPSGLDTLVEKISFGTQENGLLNSIDSRESLHRALYNLHNFITQNPNYLLNDVFNKGMFKDAK